MGLKDFVEDESGSSSSSYKRYGQHEANERLEAVIEANQEKFPEEIEVDFVEVSPQMTETALRTYTKGEYPDGTAFIRVSEGFLDHPEGLQVSILLNAMVTVYFWQNGQMDKAGSTDLYKWVCGRVSAQLNNLRNDEEAWYSVGEPMMSEDTYWTEF